MTTYTPPTPTQLDVMRDLGLTMPTDHALTRDEASDLISAALS